MEEKKKWIDEEIIKLRKTVVPSRERRLHDPNTASGRRYGVVYQDTQYHWYVQLINDCLREIRRGRAAYVFKLDHVKEILRFEPDAKFNYLSDSDSIRVTL